MTFQALLGTLDLTAIDSYGVQWTVSDAEGWSGSPASTIEVVQKPRQSGAWAGDAFFAARHLALPGMIFAPTQDLLVDAINRLNTAASLSATTLRVTEGAAVQTLLVRREDEVIVRYITDTQASYSIQLVAVDPRKFATALTGLANEFAVSGGLTIPTTVTVNCETNSGFELGVSGMAVQTSGGGAYTFTQQSGGDQGSFAGRITVVTTASTSPSVFFVNPLVTDLVAGDDFYYAVRVKPSIALTIRARRRQFSDLAGTVPAATALLDGSDVAVSAGTWTTVGVASTMTTAVLSSQAAIRIAENLPIGTTIDVDVVMVKKGLSVVAPFDGSSTSSGTTLYGWGGAVGASRSMQLVGGLTVPFTVTSTISSGLIVLTNTGNETGPVTVRIDGPCQGPVITHVGSSGTQVFALNLNLVAGEYLLIDMEKRTVYANGTASRSGYVTSRVWSGFDPGINTWLCTASAYDASALFTVTATPSNK